MIDPLWAMWLAFLLLFFVTPLGYGWGYRGWGPPYPRYIQRQRHARAAASAPNAFDHQLWGRGGDFVWVVLFIAVGWALVSAFWR